MAWWIFHTSLSGFDLGLRGSMEQGGQSVGARHGAICEARS